MTISHLYKSYGQRVIFEDFTVSFKDLAITAILGASGSGKTTLLNEIALDKAILSVSYVFQEPRLIPWKTIEKNLVLSLRGSAPENIQYIGEYLDRVGLKNRARDYPDRLSGGERQRVSIARAFANNSPVLLMDEPFQSQDPTTKKQLIELVKKLQFEDGKTIIAVTHDISDAAQLAERAIVIGGRPAKIILDTTVDLDFEAKISKILSTQTALIQ